MTRSAEDEEIRSIAASLRNGTAHDAVLRRAATLLEVLARRPSKRNITCPVEQVVAGALDAAGVSYIHDSEGEAVTRNLDFYLPGSDVWIEVKRMHSPRIAEQMSRAENIIAIQGKWAAEVFAALVASEEKPPA